MAEGFKDRMRRLRLRAGLRSQQAAADAIGCERGTVGMWEAPSSPVDSIGGDYLLRVARAYKVRPEYLNTGRGDDGYPFDPRQSQTVKLDASIVAEVARALQAIHEESGLPTGVERYADLFVKLYQERMKLENMSPQRLTAIAARWVAQGTVDGRDARVPPSGTHSTAAGHQRRAKG